MHFGLVLFCDRVLRSLFGLFEFLLAVSVFRPYYFGFRFDLVGLRFDLVGLRFDHFGFDQVLLCGRSQGLVAVLFFAPQGHTYALFGFFLVIVP